MNHALAKGLAFPAMAGLSIPLSAETNEALEEFDRFLSFHEQPQNDDDDDDNDNGDDDDVSTLNESVKTASTGIDDDEDEDDDEDDEDPKNPTAAASSASSPSLSSASSASSASAAAAGSLQTSSPAEGGQLISRYKSKRRKRGIFLPVPKEAPLSSPSSKLLAFMKGKPKDKDHQQQPSPVSPASPRASTQSQSPLQPHPQPQPQPQPQAQSQSQSQQQLKSFPPLPPSQNSKPSLAQTPPSSTRKLSDTPAVPAAAPLTLVLPDVAEIEDPYSAYMTTPQPQNSREEEEFRTRTLTDLSLGSSEKDLKRFQSEHVNVRKFSVNLFTPAEGKSQKKFIVTIGPRGLLISATDGNPLRAFYLEQLEQLTAKKLPNGVFILEIDFLRPRVGGSKPFGRLILMTKKAEVIKQELMLAEERQLLEQKKKRF